MSGLRMRNFTEHLGRTYAKGGSQFADSAIDNVYGIGPLFDGLRGLSVTLQGPYGSDHFAVTVTVETKE